MSTVSIDIRRARLEDAAGIAAVHDQAWRNAYRGILPGLDLERMVERRGPAWWSKALRRQVVVLVLEVDGQVVGYATVGPSRMRTLPYKGEIYEIYLLPQYQGVGLGRRLFQAARRTLSELKFAGLAVRALRANAGAVNFYRRLGGRTVVETGERVGDTVLPVLVFGWDVS
ncbi:GNAT family N-acetyltransferase [Mongoliimonas terrestris]|uniref:GNAT family N-acetyltransferase n=1 Tax=Mongoliimonas terrestris TaxID=1709001 RepID=UPI000949A3D4|nr:GNAT family N-acetyltransferase [Mongoliimonas terrestris]